VSLRVGHLVAWPPLAVWQSRQPVWLQAVTALQSARLQPLLTQRLSQQTLPWKFQGAVPDTGSDQPCTASGRLTEVAAAGSAATGLITSFFYGPGSACQAFLLRQGC